MYCSKTFDNKFVRFRIVSFHIFYRKVLLSVINYFCSLILSLSLFYLSFFLLTHLLFLPFFSYRISLSFPLHFLPLSLSHSNTNNNNLYITNLSLIVIFFRKAVKVIINYIKLWSIRKIYTQNIIACMLYCNFCKRIFYCCCNVVATLLCCIETRV